MTNLNLKLLPLLFGACTVQSGAVATTPATQPAAQPQAATPQEAFDGPFTCGGSEDLEISGKTISTDFDAIVVSGACNLRIIDCNLSGTNGVVVTGSGDVFISNSDIMASEFALVVQGAGDIHIAGSRVNGASGSMHITGSGDVRGDTTEFTGAKVIEGSGDFSDGGRNTWN